MDYDDALSAWGIAKLKKIYPDDEFTEARVELDYEEGYACCGGYNPDCYCSYAESPRCEVRIEGVRVDGYMGCTWTIPAEDFDFATMIRELVEAAGGLVVSE